MKNKLIIMAVGLLVLCLPSCDFSQKEPEKPTVVATYLVDGRTKTYNIGDTYTLGTRRDYTFVYEFSDGSKTEYPVERVYNLETLVNQDISYSYSDFTFASAGKHAVGIKAKCNGEINIHSTYIDIDSGVDLNYSLKSIALLNDLAYTKGEVFNEINPNIFVNVEWLNGSETLKEIFPSYSEYLATSLTKESGTSDVSDSVLEGGKTYTYSAYLTRNSTKKIEKTFTVSNNVGHYQMEESSLVYDEFTSSAPHDGEANMLVILIDLETGNQTEEDTYSKIDWNESHIQKANDYFFGSREVTPDSWNSLKTYYETTSLNQISIGGFVADVYRPDPEDFTMKSILTANYSYGELHKLFAEAINAAQTRRPDLDWTSFDKNRDGYIDNLHFITNATYQTSQMGGDSRALWPHKYALSHKEAPNLDMPKGNVYEQTCLGHFNDARTIIHEQGHVFGISDYYDYSYVGLDYIGCLDMQSHNVLDWNPFSKFSVGWAKPYVIDGKADSTTVRIKPGSTANQSLVIPANHNTYNGSAFDEYFLVELFTNGGNNAYDWKKYLGSEITAGIRIYHVDARLANIYYNQYVGSVEDAKELYTSGYFVDTASNNSSNYRDYAHSTYVGKDYKLLSLIQSGGKNTFGQAQGRGNEVKLSVSDLFYTGSTFEFEKYSHFLRKDGETTTRTNKGETFPYRITIQSVSNEEAIVTVTKI